MLKLLSNSIMKSIIPRQSLTVTVTTSAKYGQQETVQQEEKSYKYDVPHYKKIEAWDKENNNVKILGKIMGSKRDRSESDSLVLEGVRMITEAMKRGHTPSVVVFSREKLLWQLGLDKSNSNNCKLYHLPYRNIKMWTDLTTSPGIMAAFSKQEVKNKALACSPVALTLVCDNIRTPDNMGAVIRVAAAAGARHVICTRGCCDVWAPKVVRAGAGAHFLLPITENVEWTHMDKHVDPYAKVFLSDLIHEHQEYSDPKNTIEDLDKIIEEDGIDKCFANRDLCDQFKDIPMETVNYEDVSLTGYKEAVVVVGGETEGVSGAAYMYSHRGAGSRLHVPLLNNVDSLNVVSAASLVLFKVREALLKNNKKIKK